MHSEDIEYLGKGSYTSLQFRLSRQVNFTLLGGIGDIRINQSATEEQIKEALDFFREG